jgi:DNA modification methylase
MPRKHAFDSVETAVGLIEGDALRSIQQLPSDVFHCVLTSPPYYWARDYGFDEQLGHEDTPEEYVERLCLIFDEVKRVLHPEGVFFLNIGDTYYSGNGQPHGSDPRSGSRNFMRRKLRAVDRSGWSIPKKSLIGIPWKTAFALQQRGWTLRAEIVWNRGNAFAEPTARDRPHRQHEMIFMMTRSRFYSFDRTALPEESVWNVDIDRRKLIEHNAPFPEEIARRCITAASPPGGWVLDPFVGSGTTVDVAQKLGRNSVGIDFSSQYISELGKVLVRKGNSAMRWEELQDKFMITPSKWLSWKGNKRNFRKPGSKLSSR